LEFNITKYFQMKASERDRNIKSYYYFGFLILKLFSNKQF